MFLFGCGALGHDSRALSEPTRALPPGGPYLLHMHRIYRYLLHFEATGTRIGCSSTPVEPLGARKCCSSPPAEPLGGRKCCSSPPAEPLGARKCCSRPPLELFSVRKCYSRWRQSYSPLENDARACFETTRYPKTLLELASKTLCVRSHSSKPLHETTV